MNNFKKKQIDNGYVFYRTYKKQKTEITVEANIGDYIPIWSIVVMNEETT